MTDTPVTGPSPDCGYTEENVEPLKGVPVRIAGGWFHEYGWTGPQDFEAAQDAVEALGFTFVYGGADSREEWPGWPAYADQHLIRAEAQAEEISRLREFGEHYSGAAQDAWDRIVVLEKALREIAELRVASPYGRQLDAAQARAIARAALAAGSASPGGAET